MQIKKEQLEEKNRLETISKLMNIHIDINLTDDAIRNENILFESVNQIRKIWKSKTTNQIAEVAFSPWRGNEYMDADGNKLKYTYGRLYSDADVANKYLSYESADFLSQTYLYDSGMAAICNTINVIETMCGKINVFLSAGYFETRLFFESLKSRGISVNSEADINYNVFFIEPIQYFTSLKAIDYEKIIETISLSKASVKYVIFDLTMHFSNSLCDVFNKRLRMSNIIYIYIRSGIKLDQQGLEIDDLGVANWYVKDVLFPKFIFKYISDYKNWTGTNISFEKAQRMRCFNAINSQEYAKLVHKMVIKLYENISITCNRYITNIDFPVVKIDALELSMPFVFIKFNINSDEYSILLDNIINEVEKEGVFLHYRNSFGFRFPSIEYIKDFKTKDCVMKVCAGVFEGATFNCLLGLLNDFGRGNISKTHINVIKGIESWKEYLAEG